jgi:transcriptional regulator with XRE-family HTH domain
MTEKSFANWNSLSDKSLQEQVGIFVKHHRLEQNITQENLTKSAGISRSTLSLLERGESVTIASFIQVLRVLGQLQIFDSFLVTEIQSPLALAKIEKQKRKRASKNDPNLTQENNW